MGKTNSKEDTQKAVLRQHRQGNAKRANAKVEDIRIQLRDLAIQLGPGERLPTIRELCTMLNTSSATLTEALDLLEIERVLDRKERQGVFVSKHIHSKTIHIIFNVTNLASTSSSPFWGLLWGHISQEAKRRETYKHEQYTFHFVTETPDHKLPPEDIAMLTSQRVDGCLVVGFSLLDSDTDVRPKPSQLQIPHAVFAGDGYSMVVMDQFEAGRMASQALLGLGCRNIGYWTLHTPMTAPHNNQHVAALRQVLAEHNIPYHSHFTHYIENPLLGIGKSLTRQEHGYLIAQEIFGRTRTTRPDGIFIGEDMITDGALVAFEELGIQVGRDIQIATHANANSPILFGRTKHMIITEFDAADIAHAMFAALDAAITNFTSVERNTRVRPKLKIGSLIANHTA